MSAIIQFHCHHACSRLITASEANSEQSNKEYPITMPCRSRSGLVSDSKTQIYLIKCGCTFKHQSTDHVGFQRGKYIMLAGFFINHYPQPTFFAHQINLYISLFRPDPTLTRGRPKQWTIPCENTMSINEIITQVK